MASVKPLENFAISNKESKKDKRLKSQKSAPICISLPEPLLKIIDETRGDTKRSTFISRILAEKLGVVIK